MGTSAMRTSFFFEEGHIYDVKGDTSFMSAATSVHSFFEGFGVGKVIQNIKKSATWKTKEYHGMTDEEIKLQWETNGVVCSGSSTMRMAVKTCHVEHRGCSRRGWKSFEFTDLKGESGRGDRKNSF